MGKKSKRGKRGKHLNRLPPRSVAGKSKRDFRVVQSAFRADRTTWILENQDLVERWESVNLAAEDRDATVSGAGAVGSATQAGSEGVDDPNASDSSVSL